MTISAEERLDRLERLVEANSQAIAHLTQQQGEILERMDRLSGDTEKLSGRVEKLSGDVEKLTFKFDTSQTLGERLERLATSLIAGATISIIAGVILVLLREGSR
ncbi:hypothetical protein [Thermostichus vulcanus]|uniref:Uncharacterized protein n=1 Tax=Thermostichus vulcanus str. 'Rupite' TaxID=2813851 RepID=A0ABT0CAQ2_THEVL|nr:hypothetical protein [Thermostichus vulcanus]MCJ2542859.1 hypothetical protein [Thermostichus vulcanus str. 'Rupite']